MTIPTPSADVVDVDDELIRLVHAQPIPTVPGDPRTPLQSGESRAWTMSGDVD
jgi:hypothetical protein